MDASDCASAAGDDHPIIGAWQHWLDPASDQGHFLRPSLVGSTICSVPIPALGIMADEALQLGISDEDTIGHPPFLWRRQRLAIAIDYEGLGEALS